jgi:amino acid transporter
MAQTSPPGLVRGIRRWDLVALGINCIVGAGIFGLPARVYSLSGPAGLLACAVCAGACLPIVLCFAEVSSRFTGTGGPYLYAREAFGPVLGFELGWLRWLIPVTSFAANSNLLVDYLSYIWPISTGPWRTLVITAVVFSVTTISVIGVRQTAVVSNIFAAAKLMPLLLFIVVGIYFVSPRSLSITSPPSYGAFSGSVLLLLYAFTGFESVPIPAGEVRDPQRTVPFSLFTTLSIVTLLYVLILGVCIGTLPELASSARPLADASSRFLGISGGYIISAGALVSIAGNLSGKLLFGPRVLFAMAEQGQLPRILAAKHRRLRTPYISILLSAGVSLGLALSGTFIQLVTIGTLANLFTYAVTCAALPILRRKRNVLAATFRLPAGFLIAAVSVALCVWIVSNSTGREALITAVAMGVGLLLYFAYRIRKTGEYSEVEISRETAM